MTDENGAKGDGASTAAPSAMKVSSSCPCETSLRLSREKPQSATSFSVPAQEMVQFIRELKIQKVKCKIKDWPRQRRQVGASLIFNFLFLILNFRHGLLSPFTRPESWPSRRSMSSSLRVCSSMSSKVRFNNAIVIWPFCSSAACILSPAS